MEGKQADKDASRQFNGQFLTPVKGYQEASQNKSTTAHLNSTEGFSFEKIMQRQKLAVKYCSANLNELLASDIKFKSPANGFRPNLTPARKDWEDRSFFNLVEEFEESASRYITNKLNLDMSVRKNPLSEHQLQDDDLLKDPVFDLPNNLEFSIPCRSDFHVEESYLPKYMASFNYRLPNTLSSHQYYSPSEMGIHSEEYRKRKRKNNSQLKILKSEFLKCDNWNKEKITQVSQITGLSESQVYKWCWDQKKKVEEQETKGPKHPDSMLFCSDLFMNQTNLGYNPQESSMKEGQQRPSIDGLSKRKPDKESFSLLPLNKM